MKDQILHALVCDGQAAMLMINASETVKEAKSLLGLSAGVTNAMGRLICAGALLAQRNKNESEKLTLIINGQGAAGKLLVTADNSGCVKACADEPKAALPSEEISIPALVGKNGQLTVVRDNPLGKEPYVGMCNLVSGDITRDFAAYLVTSEQQPAAVALDCDTVNDKLICGGIMVMPLPGCSNEALDLIDKKISAMNDLLAKLDYHLSLEEMALDSFWDVGVKPLETVDLRYYCDCSRDRFEQALISLGREELLSLAYEEEDTEICCRFCNKKYVFDSEQLKNLAKGLK
ncbi:MAG: Hsp33 family molecular chaperone HslO [Clostridia bacterium]|nr:Hsp33 family molecular chaperone HslO [Clostridia bacterium]